MTLDHSPTNTPFHDVDQFIALPRLAGLALSPDGTRLVTSVATLNAKKTAYRTALWDIDPAEDGPARRLTRSAKGEASPVFAHNGDLYFTSSRPAGEEDDEGDGAALWRIPNSGGEAEQVLSRAGGVAGLIVASSAETMIITAPVLAGSTDEDDDAARRSLRKDKKVAAILHSGYPIRDWDHDIGPDEARLFALEQKKTDDEGEQASTTDSSLSATNESEPPRELRNLTPDAGTSLGNADVVISADGRTVISSCQRLLAKGDSRSYLMTIDVESGRSRTLLSDDSADYSPGPVSPDGSQVIVQITTVTDASTAPRNSLGLVSLDGGDLVPLAEHWDRWPSAAGWLPDGSGIVVTADDDGGCPVFIIDVETGEVRRLTKDAASYSDVVVSPTADCVYALRSSYEFPAEPVEVNVSTGDVRVLSSPVDRPVLPGRLERVETTADDGTRIASWLVLPHGAATEDPAPLLLWVHGGPLGSWNAWSWRWTPWNMAALGYAVLLPDPALSTGYGQDFIQRGWGSWGSEPYTDLMAALDGVLSRPDIDETRTAAMGGSFGGYMANWIAGHTDRFNCIVTHASLWALDQFGPTTDFSTYWEREMTPKMVEENSPHQSVANISTPMLVIHGDKDYRVPIGEGLRLWYDLMSKSALPADEKGETDHRFLFFPDENHWILQPQHARIWYLTVQHFLAQHGMGPGVELPKELGR